METAGSQMLKMKTDQQEMLGQDKVEIPGSTDQQVIWKNMWILNESDEDDNLAAQEYVHSPFEVTRRMKEIVRCVP